MRCLLALAALAGLCACTAAPPPAEISSVRFGAITLPRGVARSNADLAQDFVDLTFGLESGEDLDHLLRYEAPVRVYLRSSDLAAYRPDLTALIARLRTEAGIDIAETDDPRRAQITIEAVPSAQITRVFPTAACFIVPGETDWGASSGARRRGGSAGRTRRRSSAPPSSCRSTPRRRTRATASTRSSPRRSDPPTTSIACRIRFGTTTTSTAWRRRST